MASMPNWQAAVNGLLANPNAVNASAQVNQMLGTHGITPIYETGRFGVPYGGANFTWVNYGNAIDLDQPFVMPGGVGTNVVRVSIPLQPVGNGADLLVSLYPDNGSGSPNTTTLLASTKIPATWITHMAAPNGLANAGPLAVPTYNTYGATGGFQSQPWAGPVGDSSGVAQNSSVAVSGNYLITAGGSTSTAIVPVVNTIAYLGGASMGRGTPQPSLPMGTSFGMLAATNDSLVYSGGLVGTVGSPTATHNVWVSSWNSSSDVVGSWSSQAPLPSAVYAAGTASSPATGTVYVIGGTDSSTTSSTVYYTNVKNGQISSWNTGPSLPVALNSTMCAVVNGWLIVIGGNTSPTLSNAGATVVNTSYYAKVQPDGSLSSWTRGPSIFNACCYAPGWNVAAIDSAIVAVAGFAGSGFGSQYVQALSVGANGPAPGFQFSLWRETGAEMMAAFPTGGQGEWFLVNTNIPVSEYFYTTLAPVPIISVPLGAALTAGATYHVVLQQNQLASASDYLNYGLLDQSPLGGPDALKSNRHSGVWTSALGVGWNLNMSVYNNEPSLGPVIQTYEDQGSRITTTIVGVNKLPLGFLEATSLPNVPINSNPTFTSGTAGWTATNCTLAQSNAQTHGGFAFSGLLTPNGSSATVLVESNKGPVQGNSSTVNPPTWYQAQGWVYSPTGYSNVSLSVKWYDSAGTLLSTSSNVVSVPAATWTYLNSYFVVPVGAAQATLVPTESGTPAAGNTLYLSNVTLTLAPECVGTQASVTQVTYPTGAQWPPTGVTQLA